MTADGAELLIAGVEYVCRVCAEQRTVYVSPIEHDGDPVVDLGSRHRLVSVPCDRCGCDRTHVAFGALSERSKARLDGVRTDGGVIPDDIDAEILYRRLNARSSTPPDRQRRCPRCDSRVIFPRTGGMRAGKRPAADFRCHKCGELFNEEGF